MPGNAVPRTGRGAAPRLCSAIIPRRRSPAPARPCSSHKHPQLRGLLHLLGQGDAIGEQHRVDLNAAGIAISSAGLVAVLSDEVVVVRDEKKEVVGIGGIERWN